MDMYGVKSGIYILSLRPAITQNLKVSRFIATRRIKMMSQPRLSTDVLAPNRDF